MYNAEKLTSIDLGRQGENLARTVEIDVSVMLAQWPDASITLLVKRKHDAEPYIADTAVENGVLIWPITKVETADAGDGKLEIRATYGEVIAKSATGSFRVTASLTGGGTEPPETEQGWVEKVLAAGAGVEQNASLASEAADRAEAAAETAESSIAQVQSDAQTAAAKAEEAKKSAETASIANTNAAASAKVAQEAQADAQEAGKSAADSALAAEQATLAAEAAQKAAVGQATAAGEAAQAAAENAREAQTNANAAAASAEEANAAAAQAAQEAQAASDAKGQAEDARDNAKTSEEAAASSATAAKASEDAASGSAKAASDAAADALERLNGAEAARDAAEAAQEVAEDSAAQAEQSAAKAEEAVQTALGILDDTVTATDSTWSSQRIADMLCPTFSETGNPIICHPIEGYPLSVKASWAPRQHFEWQVREAESTQITTTGAQMLQPSGTLGGATDLAITANDDGSYTYVSTDAVYQSARFYNIAPITLKAGVSYTLSIDKELDVDIRVAGGGRIVAGETSVTFAPSADTLVDHVAIDRPTGHSGTNTVKVMLCEGDAAKPWEPYTGGQATPRPDYPQTITDSLVAGDYYALCATGGYWKISLDGIMGGVSGYADAVEIDAYTGRYRVVTRAGTYAFTGEEKWVATATNTSGLFRMHLSTHGLPMVIPTASSVVVNALCTHYAVVSADKTYLLNSGFSVNSGGNICIYDPNFQTVDDWRAFLTSQYVAGTPVTVRYALATPSIVTGQATHVTSNSGLTALGESSMALTEVDPAHPCMITRTETVNVTRCGKNLLPNFVFEEITKNGVTFKMNSDGSMHVSGTATVNTDSPVHYLTGYSLPVGGYRGINTAGVHSSLVVLKKATGMRIWYNPANISIEEGDEVQYWYCSVHSGVTVDTDVYPYVQYGDEALTAKDWEPYQGDMYTFALSAAVYAGELDTTTGNGTTAVCGEVLDGSEEWSELTIGDRVYFQCVLSSDSNRQPSTTSSVDAAKRVQRSSHFTVGNPWASNVDDCFWVFSTPSLLYPSLRLRSSTRFSSVEELQAYLAAEKAAGTPVTIVYEMIASETFAAEGATPILALNGINTLYTDVDSLAVSGRTDPLHTLESITDRLAALEAAAIGGNV